MLLFALVGCPGPAPLDAARAFSASRPVYEQPLADGLVAPPGLALDAASCGACHAEIYAEWKVSTHAHAWEDRQLQAEMTKSENRWMCQNCHTPLVIQQARLPVALTDGDVEKPVWVDNPAFRADLQAEGITCVSCHLRDGVLVGPTGAATDAHPTAVDATFRSADLCLRCHQAVAEYPGKTFTCTFHTGEEWAAGPFGQAGVPCQQCHMPAIERPAATGAEPRLTRRHWWAGGGIPKVEGVLPPPDALPPGLLVSAAPTPGGVRVSLVNANAGHMVPTGDPERFYLVEVRFEGPSGDALTTETLRIGQTWEWWPAPRKLADNRLAPQEWREVDVPAPPGAVAAVVTTSRHRMTAETRDYHHLDGYPIAAPVGEQRVVLAP